MFSLLLHPDPAQEDYLIAELLESGTAGIVEEDGGIRAFFSESDSLDALLSRFSQFAPEARQEHPIDWAQVSRDAWPPLPVGERFYLVPPWLPDEPTPAGRLRLEIYPGMACGTGQHPATQLCLRALERYVRPGTNVLDIGTGSGILARAATLLGAGRVVACDIDEQAIRIAREFSGSVMLFVGSTDAVRSRWADVVVANIDSATIEALEPELARVRQHDSILILSGFPASDLPHGFRPSESLTKNGWLCLIC